MTHQLFPYAGSVWAEPRTLTRQVWDGQTARGIPGVARSLELYSGLISGCPMDAVRGEDVLPRPRILDRPDPDMARLTFVKLMVEDYLLHGNAVGLVTVRGVDGWPLAVRWFSPLRWSIVEDPTGAPAYYLDGTKVRRDDIVHVQRGADPFFPWRGMGVVEQHIRTLNRAGLQEEAETANLTDRAMPNVAIIAPNPELVEADADAAADKWVERFSGPTPRPGIFPKDTTIVPLSWNPADAQLVQAKALTLKDIANVFNLDGYWLGAEGSSHTYRSPGPMFLTLLRTSLAPVMATFEDEWSDKFLVRGQRVRFDRSELLRDDLLTMAQAYVQGAALFPDKNEFRKLMGLPALPEDAFPKVPTPPPAPPPPPADPNADPNNPTPQEVPA